MTEKIKRTRTCAKYHYDMIQICRETDSVFTKCRICGERKPRDLKHFAKETHIGAKRELQPLCRECLKEQQKVRNKRSREKEQIKEEVQPVKVEVQPLFEEETVETKLNKVIAFLSKFGLK